MVDPFAALADPVRRALLRSLVGGPARVVDLAADHPISRPAVSRHLRVLAEAGLVVVTRRGRERHYALRPDGLGTVAALIEELSGPSRLSERFAGALDALDTEVRRTGRDRRDRDGVETPTRQEETA